jgi:hypothetical protein
MNHDQLTSLFFNFSRGLDLCALTAFRRFLYRELPAFPLGKQPLIVGGGGGGFTTKETAKVAEGSETGGGGQEVGASLDARMPGRGGPADKDQSVHPLLRFSSLETRIGKENGERITKGS